MVPPEVQEVNVKPLRQCPSTDCLRKQRIPSNKEEVVKSRCERFLQVGHSQATCKILILLDPS